MNIFISEILGTFILVSFVLLTNNPIYIAFGFLAAILVSNISNGHINPVITMVKSMQGIITNKEVFEYLAGQMTGALLALYFVNYQK